MQFLEKTMESVREHRDVKLVIINKRRDFLVSECNYHTLKCFLKKLLAIEIKISISKNK